MLFSFSKAGLAACAMLLAVPAFSADQQAPATKTKTHEAVMPSHLSKAERAKLVDVNTVPKADLMKLPGIDGPLADQIIKGRPYLSKANLVSHKVITMDQYQGIREHIRVSIKPSPKAAVKK
jgi:DNA uptake protein ComE-like DNA-binding protein